MASHIRQERPDDVESIHRVTELAFRDAPHTDHTEPFIVDVLRRSGVLAVSLVAESQGEVIGHVAISPVSVSDGAAGWYGLGPISVYPDHQRQGVGSQLMTRALDELQGLGAAGCVVLGYPGYYSRFGFRVVPGLVYPGVPAEYFQSLSLSGEYPKGEVTYHQAFVVKA
ncbi:GNAT family N-acetyltransferase [Halomonas urumqiensis]|uniref:GNAT family N-acetyltransferase n=1 Tax=Halomonas urumqiensis TaxID=1684789 RepID=A0A2N7UQT2_9GAMM|nr:N-acetyltransferase [Halomonas urumqiensis]PMR82780.1 GNAT family N-acetyltransferase [Halomonas urumqiensis]PTB01901.1 N-acetyltransferase [Halomonas urumqiensis]GHE22008.1 GNAT family N-acetyltransferase [Halomonas urumqiensis]